MDNAAIKVRVSGRVQGVGYRNYAQNRGFHLGLNGYVKNLEDGDVEIYAEGSRDKLEQYLEDLRQGPRAARVDALAVSWHEYTGAHKTFTVRIE